MQLRDDFWNYAKATHSYVFWLHMRLLKPKKDQKPYDWLINIPLSQWSRHSFWPEAKCDNYTNNITVIQQLDWKTLEYANHKYY